MEQKAELAELVGLRGTMSRWLDGLVSSLDKTTPLVRWMSILGMGVFVLMVILTFVDVILRYVFNRPIAGSIEITAFMMVIVVFLGTAFTQYSKAHVTMDVITHRLRRKRQLVFEAFGYFLSLVILIIMTWRVFNNALTNPEETGALHFSIKPFIFIAFFGIVILTIMMLRDYVMSLAEGVKHKGYFWVLLIIIPVAVAGFLAWFALNQVGLESLSKVTWGIIGVLVMLVFFCTGMPIAFVLFMLGFVGLVFFRGSLPGLDQLGKVWYDTVSNYSWSPIMFFLLMGFICFECRFGEDLFRMAQKFIGHFRGGLAMGISLACTIFGAVVGDSLSGTVTMTAIGLPEMKRYKYNEKLAIGVLACSGPIGSLIPPSIHFIIYAVLAEQSVGDMFMAGIIPGILCCLIYMAIIYIMCLINPAMGPATQKTSWGERGGSLKGAGPIGLLFLLVIGGIYAGIFTATEGGGIGAFGALVIGLSMRRLTWKTFKAAMAESGKMVAMCFTILGGAVIFGFFVVQSQLPMVMAEEIGALEVHWVVIMIVIVVIYFTLGCFLPALPLMLITVPIFIPIAISQGWDLIWFGVIVSLCWNMAAITPPFGINLFVMKGLTQKPIGEIYASVWPFVLGLAIVVALCIAFEPISTWIPSLIVR
jgi:tripartite ATP-independent transporter DctM subunit